MKATFFRKCANEKDFSLMSNQFNLLGDEAEYVIEKKIILSADDYDLFKNGFLYDNINIINNLDLMFIDNSKTIHCLLFTHDNKSGFLVYSSGYNYARYVAKWESEENLNV